MKRIQGMLSAYSPRFPATIVYMLQSTEYDVTTFLAWFWRTDDFSKVMRRRQLDRTKRAKLLLAGLTAGMLLQILLAALILIYSWRRNSVLGYVLGSTIMLSTPYVWAHLIVIPLYAAKQLITRPADSKAIRRSKVIFAAHPGAKIAVAGSYGKTTMKEILLTVLSEGKKVAATPANKNVAISHARFAASLDGDEDILILEYGEGEPGDVGRFTVVTHPTHAVVTGIAPAHLDKYKTVAAAAQDIFSVTSALEPQQVYVNADTTSTEPYIQPDFVTYDQQGAGGWKADMIEITLHGTSFRLTNGKRRLRLSSGLLGRHQIGPLSAAAVLAMQLGLSSKQIEQGIANTKAFEHRMSTYPLAGGWVIDDTYNGNLEGLRAGTSLLHDLPAKRKWYVTPGLVDQGDETRRVHVDAGKLIALAEPDIVVLMQNSVTAYIQTGLTEAGYQGEIRIEADPLSFYQGLEHFMAAGDVVLMQNDWTDNYA